METLKNFWALKTRRKKYTLKNTLTFLLLNMYDLLIQHYISKDHVGRNDFWDLGYGRKLRNILVVGQSEIWMIQTFNYFSMILKISFLQLRCGRKKNCIISHKIVQFSRVSIRVSSFLSTPFIFKSEFEVCFFQKCLKKLMKRLC